MKRFEDLTHDELVALTDRDTNYYIEFACAEDGVPLLPPTAPVAPEIVQVPKTVTHYTLGTFRFTDKSEADDVCQLLNQCKSRRTIAYIGSRWSGPTHDAQEIETVSVGIDPTYDAEGAARQMVEDEGKADRKRSYEAAKKTYDSAVNGREQVARNIRRTIAEAHDLQYQRDKLTAELARYVELAGGDNEIALRFLVKAYPEAWRVLPALFADAAPVPYEITQAEEPSF